MSSDRNFWRGDILYIDNQNHRFVRKFDCGLSDRGILAYFWSAIFHPKIFNSVRMAGKGLNIFTFLEKIAALHASFLLQTHASLASKNRALFSLTKAGFRRYETQSSFRNLWKLIFCEVFGRLLNELWVSFLRKARIRERKKHSTHLSALFGPFLRLFWTKKLFLLLSGWLRGFWFSWNPEKNQFFSIPSFFQSNSKISSFNNLINFSIFSKYKKSAKNCTKNGSNSGYYQDLTRQ